MKMLLNMLISVLVTGLASCQETRTVRVNVSGEDGMPIKGVDVLVNFLGYSGDDTQRVKGKTDGEGTFIVQGNPTLRMSVVLKKVGYYKVTSGRLSRTKDHDVAFVLRKMKNPVALYARKLHLQIPKNREWLGFDLKSGDWVVPEGKGKVADFFIRCDTEVVGKRSAKGSFELKFDTGGGIVVEENKYLEGSHMKMPHLAPSEHYLTNFFRKEDAYHDKQMRPNIGYFFKTRIVKEGNKVIAANYGKILSDFAFDPRGSRFYSQNGSFATISFTYYFNPTPNDRNLEFDPKQNLFKGLDVTEMVREP